jgi:hypothetical protein
MKGWIQRIRKSGQNSFELQPDMPLDPESVGFPPSAMRTGQFQYPRFVTTEMLEGEIEIIDRYLRDKFPSPVQMIHNDIFMPNILITSKTEPEKSLVLIDYEFSMKTHRFGLFSSEYPNHRACPGTGLGIGSRDWSRDRDRDWSELSLSVGFFQSP